MNTELAKNTEQVQLPYNVLTFIAHESAPGFTPLNNSGAGEGAGGSAVVAEMQTKEFGLNGTILSPRPSVDYISTDPSHIFFDPVQISEIYANPLENQSLVQEILQSAQNADIVYAHYPVAGIIIAALKREGRLGEKKFVYMGHTWGRVVDPTNENRRRNANPERYKAEETILQEADVIITATEAERQMIARDYAIPFRKTVVDAILQKIRVVPLGVDHAQFNPEKRQLRRQQVRKSYLGQHSESLNFFMLARFETLKGQLAAVKGFSEAYTRLKNEGKNSDISLSLFGGPIGGAYYGRIIEFLDGLEDPIKDEVKSRVMFHGGVPALDAIATGDVFLGPSSFESFYLSFVEAGACAIPAILSNIPTICEVAGESPWYVPPPDTNDDSVVDIARGIIAMTTDTAYREECSQAVFNQVAQYTWENSSSHLKDVFREVLSEKN